MPHELAHREDGQAMMFYAGELPWHKLGVGVKEAQKSSDAARLAGIDWDVQVGPVYGGPDKVEISHKRAVYRVTDGAVLGVVGRGYVPVQNREAFEFMDSLVDDRVMQYETAGALFEGRQVWILARLDDVRVGDDDHYKYLLLTNAHDGSRALSVFPTVVRAVCHNTVSLAFSSRKAEDTVWLPHTRNVLSRLDTARQILRLTTESQRRYIEWMQTLAQTTITENQYELVQTDLFGPLDDQTSGQREKAIETFRKIYDAETERVGETAYALANAVTGYGDFGINYRAREHAESARMMSIVVGSGAQFKAKGLTHVAKVAEVPMTFALNVGGARAN